MHHIDAEAGISPFQKIIILGLVANIGDIHVPTFVLMHLWDCSFSGETIGGITGGAKAGQEVVGEGACSCISRHE
jgi:hypothetical protein